MASRNVIRKNVELNTDSVERFEIMYPEASLAAVISMLFDKFMEHSTVTPQHYIERAAKELSEDLNRAVDQ
jgi:hypothetical protein